MKTVYLKINSNDCVLVSYYYTNNDDDQAIADAGDGSAIDWVISGYDII